MFTHDRAPRAANNMTGDTVTLNPDLTTYRGNRGGQLVEARVHSDEIPAQEVLVRTRNEIKQFAEERTFHCLARSCSPYCLRQKL